MSLTRIRETDDAVVVGSVLEHHDCMGRKSIDVSPENTLARFRLTKAYMPPLDKLQLATVGPTDRVLIHPKEMSPRVNIGAGLSLFEEYLAEDPLVLGEYTANLSAGYYRDPICQCGTVLVSDGFDIYCPHDQCGLTLLARIQRLASAEFFSYESLGEEFYNEDSILLTNDQYFTQPFKLLLDPRLWGDTRLWGEQRLSLEYILLHKKPQHISLATFLVEPLFRDFLDCTSPHFDFDSLPFQNVRNFYAHMVELTQRRNYNAEYQNRLIKQFFMALGLEMLHEDVIDKMVTYEQQLGWSDDVFVPYVYFLTHPMEMIKELGLHMIEAREIHREFMSRAHEFIDIFSRYTELEALRDIFRDVRPPHVLKQ